MLLERSASLDALTDALEAARAGSGRLVLISGEAGVGKTTVVRAFVEQAAPVRYLAGGCDALFTPSPLGPLLDVAEQVGGTLQELVARETRPHSVAAELVRELREKGPTVLVFEDVHWADEATLDVLRLLGRRAETVPALVIATYRDDELDLAHPLRIVLGELATGAAVERIRLGPLSPEAVDELARPHGVDPEELYRKTGGNAFFVTEALASGETEVPPTVRDAVVARAARLTPEARTLLEAAAVVTPPLELWLLEALTEGETGALDECLASGMLQSERDALSFRHELARLAVEGLVPPDRKRALHTRAVVALAEPPGGSPDLARLAHHAEAAGAGEAVLGYAPAAGDLAASLGAHREAAAQFARALRFAEAEPLEVKAGLLERRSYECYLTDQIEDAVLARCEALECYRSLGDRRREGDSQRWLSRLQWFLGRNREAEEAAAEAVDLLEGLPPGIELAMAYSNVAQLRMLADQSDEAIAWGTRAIELAERLGDVEVQAHALNNVGTAEMKSFGDGGALKLERSLELAQAAGLEEHVARAFCNLGAEGVQLRSYRLADRYLGEGIDYCGEHDLDSWRFYLLAWRARSQLDQGSWDAAVDSAAEVLRYAPTAPISKIPALVALALVRIRRGDPDIATPLAEARALALATGELQRVWPVAAATAEAALLEGRPDDVAEATEDALRLAAERHAPWAFGELVHLRRRAGIGDAVTVGVAEPYALQLAGEWRRAAELWREIGCPYEAALSLADGDDDARREALDALYELGARPAAAVVARQLRERGAQGLPRGPRKATRTNPANLTPRELEVLELVAGGLTNGEIADRLFLSEKTVGHHVSAVLRKLGVRSRGQASAEAVRLGIAGQDR
jgi:DNA-binding CsgD family transcriptional regulator/tetratricopeptide (TPR) repeat protein